MPNTITVRDPFHDMRHLMRRAFEENVPSWFDDLPAVSTRAARSQTLPLDVFESEEGLTVEAPLPGFAKDEVEVTLEKGKLSIRAEKSTEHEAEAGAEGRTYFLRERSHGLNSRSILIGDSYAPDSVAGSLKDGVLTISVKKAPEAQPHRVAISGE
ncbi:MAG: HSP20 family protein [Chloroflexi bacterium]|jgi:HSP20 family protein|nr:MAG: HSP20 family protein [Chloroflexota bacterium]